MIIPESSARCARRHRVRRIVLCVLTDPCTCQIDSVWQRTDESWCYLVKYDNDSALHTAGCWVTTSPWWSFRRLQIMLLDNVSAVKIKKKYIYVPLDASTAALHNHVHRFCFPHLLTKKTKQNKKTNKPKCEYFVLFLWIVFTVFHFQRTTHSVIY